MQAVRNELPYVVLRRVWVHETTFSWIVLIECLFVRGVSVLLGRLKGESEMGGELGLYSGKRSSWTS